jgi:hypothetical protein
MFWSLGELYCWVHKLLVGSPILNWSNGKGLLKGQPPGPGLGEGGGGELSRRIIACPIKQYV